MDSVCCRHGKSESFVNAFRVRVSVVDSEKETLGLRFLNILNGKFHQLFSITLAAGLMTNAKINQLTKLFLGMHRKQHDADRARRSQNRPSTSVDRILPRSYGFRVPASACGLHGVPGSRSYQRTCLQSPPRRVRRSFPGCKSLPKDRRSIDDCSSIQCDCSPMSETGRSMKIRFVRNGNPFLVRRSRSVVASGSTMACPIQQRCCRNRVSASAEQQVT